MNLLLDTINPLRGIVRSIALKLRPRGAESAGQRLDHIVRHDSIFHPPAKGARLCPSCFGLRFASAPVDLLHQVRNAPTRFFEQAFEDSTLDLEPPGAATGPF